MPLVKGKSFFSVVEEIHTLVVIHRDGNVESVHSFHLRLCQGLRKAVLAKSGARNKGDASNVCDGKLFNEGDRNFSAELEGSKKELVLVLRSTEWDEGDGPVKLKGG